MHADPSVSSGAHTTQGAPSAGGGVGALSRTIVEVIAKSGDKGVALDELKRKVATAFDEPLLS
jgi:hypothetical protein